MFSKVDGHVILFLWKGDALMSYDLLLCDADETLFDFKKGEKQALIATFLAHGLKADEPTADLYHRINDNLWKALERREITLDELKIARFRKLISALGLSIQSEAMAASFINNLSEQAQLMPGAVRFCQMVSAKMPIYLVTNGIAAIQRGRLEKSAVAPYISDIIISEEVGARKPDPKMLEAALEKAGIQKEKAIMLGDSITADIPAAIGAGVDSILITWGKEMASAGATYCVPNLDVAAKIIL